MSDDFNNASYEVGYGKPPKQHQFKPGHTKSKGPRSKKKPSLQAIVEAELFQMLAATAKGKSIKLPAAQLVLRKQLQAALDGDPKAIMLVFKLAQLFSAPEPEEEGTVQELNASETAVLANIVKMKAFLAGEPDGE